MNTVTDSRLMKLTAVIFAGLLAMVIANAAEPTAKVEEKKDAAAATATKPVQVKKEVTPAAPAHKPTEGELPKEIKKLITQDSIIGTGKAAVKGKMIKVHYTGWLYDSTKPNGRGTKFDSSEGGEPFEFKLGGGQVIKGWDEGFESMKVGGKRKLIIPADMGYGANGASNVIPPNQALQFEVELVDVN